MKNQASTRLFGYWNDLRGPRMAPNRFEVEPSRITDILAQTFILERNANDQFMFRLAGTQICENFGREFRGEQVLGLFEQGDRSNFERILRGTFFEGSVGVVSVDARTPDGRTTSFEMLLLPLIHSGTAITRVLGAFSPDEPCPEWLGTIPLTSQSIRQISMIWPDGHPPSMIERNEHQLPFSQIPGPKRVVSIDRRNFRVFEGGRSDVPQADN
ncbi:MAG: PAS domain-containing protein [Pseudomonadota bacterium]